MSTHPDGTQQSYADIADHMHTAWPVDHPTAVELLDAGRVQLGWRVEAALAGENTEHAVIRRTEIEGRGYQAWTLALRRARRAAAAVERVSQVTR